MFENFKPKNEGILVKETSKSSVDIKLFAFLIHIYLTSWTTKPVISSMVIFEAIANNALYGSKLTIFLSCQNSLGY